MSKHLINIWSVLREIFIGGGFILITMTFWNTAKFYQELNDFMTAQKECHVEVDKKLVNLYNDIQVLKEWKVCVTNAPFYP